MKVLSILIFFLLICYGETTAQVEITGRQTNYENYSDTIFNELSSCKGMIGFLLLSKVSLSYRASDIKGDTLYKLTVIHETKAGKPIVTSLTFSSKDNALSILYNEIKKAYSRENMNNKNYLVKLKVGEENFVIKPSKIMASEWVQIAFTSKEFGSYLLSVALKENEFEKLFQISSPIIKKKK